MFKQAGEHGEGEVDVDREVDPLKAPSSLLSGLLASNPDPVVVFDEHGSIIEFNPAAERAFGHRREELMGQDMALLISSSLRGRYRGALRELEDGRINSSTVELMGLCADASEFPLECTVSRVSEAPTRFAAFLHEVAERQRATDAKELLAAASAAFDASLDPMETMRTIARSTVPHLAELCVIDLIREDGTIGDSVVAAVEPSVVERLELLRAREPLDMEGMHPVARALRSREPVVIHDLTDDTALADVAQSDEHKRFMEEVGYQSAVVIKLTARGRLLGTLSFLRMSGGPPVEADQVALMEDLSSRAAMALDNANLFAERAHVARTLQRSLLPEALPKIDGVQLASSYRPVAEGSEVGGDFYDVFGSASGCWLVVGDVCGKGTEAAALTALVRHSIRALALGQPSPAEVLRRANEVMLSHELFGRFATAVVARIDLSASPARAVLACAGHPPPIVLGPSGEALCPDVSGSLLGVLSELRLTDVEVELSPGASVVLYTDGLTDAGAPTRELAPEDLCAHLSGHAGETPAELATGLEALAVSQGEGHLRDDIAILVARLAP